MLIVYLLDKNAPYKTSSGTDKHGWRCFVGWVGSRWRKTSAKYRFFKNLAYGQAKASRFHFMVYREDVIKVTNWNFHWRNRTIKSKPSRFLYSHSAVKFYDLLPVLCFNSLNKKINLVLSEKLSMSFSNITPTPTLTGKNTLTSKDVTVIISMRRE